MSATNIDEQLGALVRVDLYRNTLYEHALLYRDARVGLRIVRWSDVLAVKIHRPPSRATVFGTPNPMRTTLELRTGKPLGFGGLLGGASGFTNTDMITSEIERRVALSRTTS